MNNTTSNITLLGLDETYWMNHTKLLVYLILNITDNLLAFLTNGGTIAIIYMHRYDMLDVPNNIFIGCLTLGDLFSVLALPPSIATYFLPHTWGWTVSCFLTLWSSMTSGYVNALTLCMIAIDRLIYIIYPLQYHTKMTVSRAFIIARSIWVISSVYSLVLISLGYKNAYNLGFIARPCHSIFSMNGLSKRLLYYPLLILVPITIGCYIKVGLVALQQRRAMTVAVGNQAQPTGIDFRITKVMFNVIAAYLICNIIVILTPQIMRHMDPDKETWEIVFKVQMYLWRMNSWLNPLIYAWKSEKFRKHVKSLFRSSQAHVTDISVIV